MCSHDPQEPALSPYTRTQFVQRARSALAMPTLYWLGKGGWNSAELEQAQPGRPINVAQELRAKELSPKASDRKVASQYRAGLAQLGMNLSQLPTLACDCSGLVAWALGLPREAAANGPPCYTLWTGSIYEDAGRAGGLFTEQALAEPGCLLVYPKSRRAAVGHVAIVTEVDRQGRATQMIHCTPSNFLITPASGGVHNAIAQTDTQIFDQHPETRIVAFTQFAP